MDQLHAAGLRLAWLQDMRQLGPTNRKIRKVEIEDGLALAGNQRHRLAAKARKIFGQRRLVGKRRNDAEAVLSRNVGSGEDADDAGMDIHPGVEIAEGEAGVMMRRANHQHRQRIGREGIAAEFFAAGDFRQAVEPDRRGTDGVA